MINDNPIILDPYEIRVYDNVLPANHVSFLEEVLITTTGWNVGLTYNGTSSFSNQSAQKYGLNKIYEQFQLGYPIIDRTQDVFNFGMMAYFLAPILNISLENRFLWDIDNMLRIKANLQTRAPKSAKDTYNFPHIDLNIPTSNEVTTFLYYVNDSDGDTYFFKEKFKEMRGHPKNLDNLTIIKKVTPKKGRVVMFRGDILHAGSHPIEYDTRMVVNYNVLLTEMKLNASAIFEKSIFKDHFPGHTPA